MGPTPTTRTGLLYLCQSLLARSPAGATPPCKELRRSDCLGGAPLRGAPPRLWPGVPKARSIIVYACLRGKTRNLGSLQSMFLLPDCSATLKRCYTKLFIYYSFFVSCIYVRQVDYIVVSAVLGWFLGCTIALRVSNDPPARRPSHGCHVAKPFISQEALAWTVHLWFTCRTDSLNAKDHSIRNARYALEPRLPSLIVSDSPQMFDSQRP